MRLTLRQLQIFCAIAEHGSTTRAAAAVALSQSAVSAALHELEEVLDTRLFDRVGRGVLLNDNGRALLPQARRMLEQAQQVEAGFRSGGAGMATRLRVGCSTTVGNYLMPRILAELHGSAPRLRVDVDLANSAAIAHKVAGFDLDMGLIEGPCHLPELQAEPWLRDELVIVAGRQHPLARKRKPTVDDLRDAGWLLREPGSGTREEVERLLLGHLHALPDTREIGSSEAIKHLLAQGIGVSCLSRWVVADLLATRQLKVLADVLPPLDRRLFLIRHRDKFVSPSLARFWDACHRFPGKAG